MMREGDRLKAKNALALAELQKVVAARGGFMSDVRQVQNPEQEHHVIS